MKRRDSGSILLLALVTVAMASLLAVGASAVLRAAISEVGHRRKAAADRLAAIECMEAFAKDVLAIDTNGIDHVGEKWRRPYPEETENGAPVLAPEFPEIDAAPCIDEESRIPLNADCEKALAQLIAARTGRPKAVAEAMAAEIASLRPFQRREFIMRAPSLTQEDYAAIAPFVTAAPSEAVNINTASRPVLEALFSAAGEFGSGAAASLARKILDFRSAGGHFTSLDAAAVDSAVGGINQSEAEVLLAVSSFLCIESRHFSAAVGPVLFTYDRKAATFPRLAY